MTVLLTKMTTTIEIERDQEIRIKTLSYGMRKYLSECDWKRCCLKDLESFDVRCLALNETITIEIYCELTSEITLENMDKILRSLLHIGMKTLLIIKIQCFGEVPPIVQRSLNCRYPFNELSVDNLLNGTSKIIHYQTRDTLLHARSSFATIILFLHHRIMSPDLIRVLKQFI